MKKSWKLLVSILAVILIVAAVSFLGGVQVGRSEFAGVGDSIPKGNEINFPFSYLIDTNSTHYFLGNGTSWKWDFISTNESKLVQWAISNSSGNIFFRPGRFIFTNPITLDADTFLIGSGYPNAPYTDTYGTVLEFQLATTNFCIKTTANVPNGGIRDLAIVSKSTYANIALLYVNMVDSFEVQGVAFYQGYADAYSMEIKTLSASGITTVERNLFYGKNENGVITSNGIYSNSTEGIDHLHFYDNGMFYMKSYGFNIDKSSQYNIIANNHFGYGFKNSSRIIDIQPYQGSWTIENNQFEMGDADSPSNWTKSGGYAVYVHYGSARSSLTMRGNAFHYSNSTADTTDWSSLVYVNRVGSGIIEGIISCVNLARTTAHKGFIGTTSNTAALIIPDQNDGTATSQVSGNTITHSLINTPTSGNVVAGTIGIVATVTAVSSTTFTLGLRWDNGTVVDANHSPTTVYWSAKFQP